MGANYSKSKIPVSICLLFSNILVDFVVDDNTPSYPSRSLFAMTFMFRCFLVTILSY